LEKKIEKKNEKLKITNVKDEANYENMLDEEFSAK
jgi:hypothetical protein